MTQQLHRASASMVLRSDGLGTFPLQESLRCSGAKQLIDGRKQKGRATAMPVQVTCHTHIPVKKPKKHDPTEVADLEESDDAWR